MGHDSPAKVYLVGGGPGNPDLLTLRGVECLRRADVVLYDYLVNPRILAHAPDAKLICLGRHGCDRVLEQVEINAQIIEQARHGQIVVRLKGGDPAVFGHLVEEVEALREAGIDYEIVPGVTAALGAASYAGIPLTQRDSASAVAFVTGQEGSGKGDQLDYASLASFPGTLVLYMGVTTVRHWSSALIAAGKPANTPAAVVVRATWPDQQVLHSNLGRLADDVEARRLRPPAVFVVGPVAALAGKLDWFGTRPLSGVTVLVTRPSRSADALTNSLTELGARVLVQPAIELSAPTDWTPVDRVISVLGKYDWLVFSSVTGVEMLFERIFETGKDLRAIGGARLAAIGPGTADALRKYHLRPDLVPPDYRGESLAAELSPHAVGKRVMLVRANRGRDIVERALHSTGAIVHEVIAYMSHDVKQADPDITELLRAGAVDWVTFTSSSIARSASMLFGADLTRAKLASISPITSAVLNELGFEPTVEAAEHTMPGLISAIRAWHDDASSGQKAPAYSAPQ